MAPYKKDCAQKNRTKQLKVKNWTGLHKGPWFVPTKRAIQTFENEKWALPKKLRPKKIEPNSGK